MADLTSNGSNLQHLCTSRFLDYIIGTSFQGIYVPLPASDCLPKCAKQEYLPKLIMCSNGAR